MTLWRPPERSDALPVSFWQSLGRHNYGGDLLVEDGLWHGFLDRLERRRGEWIKVRVIDVIAGTEEEVLRRFLSGASDLRTRLVLVCAAA